MSDNKKIVNKPSVNMTVWHVRVKNGIRQFHPSYKSLCEEELKNIPDEYWKDDPVYNTQVYTAFIRI